MEKKIYDNREEIFYKIFLDMNTLKKNQFKFIKFNINKISKKKVEYELVFQNNKKRKLSIKWFDDYFYVMIYNMNNKQDFLLENWLENYKLNIEPNPFLLDSYKGTCEEKLLSFKAYLEDIFLKDKMNKILMEEYWWRERIDPCFTFIR